MVRWSSIVEQILNKWRELAVICGCRDDEAEREVAQLPRNPPDNPFELRKCSSCMLREILEESYVVQVPLYSASTETMVYVLEDAVVEISEDCGYVVSRTNAESLVQLLDELGFDVGILREFLSKS